MTSNPPTNPSSIRFVRRPWVRGWLFWLVLWVMGSSLLLSQSLGHLHSVKHGGQATGVYAAAQQATQGNHHPDGFLDQLFSSHGSASDCRLYDHLSGGQAMPLILAAPLPIVLPSLVVAIFAGDALACWAALFDARGPPLTA